MTLKESKNYLQFSSLHPTQQASTTTEKVEKVVKYFHKVTPFSSVTTVDFGQADVRWVAICLSNDHNI